MTHFFGVVLIPGTPETEPLDIYQAVQKALAPWDENRVVAPYRLYPDADEIQQMREWYKTDNFRQLASHAYEWGGHAHGDVDEAGRLYFVSTRNPDGRYDYWCIGGNWYGEIRQKNVESHYESSPLPLERDAMLRDNMLPVKWLDHTVRCRIVVTPDGKWHQYDESWIAEPVWQTVSHEAIDEEDERRRALWYADVEELLRWNNDCIAVGLDIHR